MTRHQDIGAGRAQVVSSVAVLALLIIAGCDGGDGGSSTGGGGAGGGAGGGGGGGGGSLSCDPPPTEKPSVQKLTVELHNGTMENRYLVTECHDCDVLRVDKKGDLDYVPVRLRISAAEACGCECPNAGDPYASALHRIGPGETFTATWDGRVLAACTSQQDCGDGMTADLITGAREPAGPGDYRVSFPVIVNLPNECMEEGATGDYTCPPPPVQGIDPGGGFYPVEITFAESGDVSATLDIP